MMKNRIISVLSACILFLGVTAMNAQAAENALILSQHFRIGWKRGFAKFGKSFGKRLGKWSYCQ